MIESTKIDGKDALVIYLKDERIPCSKDEATFAKANFKDGTSMWMHFNDDADESTAKIKNVKPT